MTQASLHAAGQRWAGAAWHRKLLWGACMISLAGHMSALGAQLVIYKWGPPRELSRPAKLIYRREVIDSRSEWAKETSPRTEAQLRQRVRAMTVTVASSASRGGGMSGAGAGFTVAKPELLSDLESGTGNAWAGNMPGGGAWASAVDLTDIAAAAQGDPVLQSYYGAIREQIQRAANGRAWTEGDLTAGLVYVGFVLKKDGTLQSSGIVIERSDASSFLRRISLEIVHASSPFLPFPPSFNEPTKAIVVPIEFSVANDG